MSHLRLAWTVPSCFELSHSILPAWHNSMTSLLICDVLFPHPFIPASSLAPRSQRQIPSKALLINPANEQRKHTQCLIASIALGPARRQRFQPKTFASALHRNVMGLHYPQAFQSSQMYILTAKIPTCVQWFLSWFCFIWHQAMTQQSC